MKARPLHDRIIVKRFEEERVSEGGIALAAVEKPVQGTVIAVGRGKILEDGTIRPLDVTVGDRVLFGKGAGTEVKIGYEELLVLREEDVIAVFTGAL